MSNVYSIYIENSQGEEKKLQETKLLEFLYSEMISVQKMIESILPNVNKSKLEGLKSDYYKLSKFLNESLESLETVKEQFLENFSKFQKLLKTIVSDEVNKLTRNFSLTGNLYRKTVLKNRIENKKEIKPIGAGSQNKDFLENERDYDMELLLGSPSY